MSKEYDCCTHYSVQGYDDGYIVCPIFKVKICKNCGEVHADWGLIADILFTLLGQWIWNGDVYIYE